MAKVLAFSGSPMKGGTIEKALQAVMAATEEETEFIRLADLNLRVCVGCKKCASTNRCVFGDDINPILEKIIEAEAIIIGAHPTFGSVNALTKIFIEKLWPLRHNVLSTRGKVGAAVITGSVYPRDLADYFDHYFNFYLGARYQGALVVDGNMPCLSCGYGESCEFSGVLGVWGAGAKVTPDKFKDFNTDPSAQARAREFGRVIGRAIRAA